jgi:hypothetical protein
MRSYDDSTLSIVMAHIGPNMQVVAENSGRIMSLISNSWSKSALAVTLVTRRFRPDDWFTPQSSSFCQPWSQTICVTYNLHECFALFVQ